MTSKLFLVVIDNDLSKELLDKGMTLIDFDKNNKIWTFENDEMKFNFSKDLKDKCFITDRFKINF